MTAEQGPEGPCFRFNCAALRFRSGMTECDYVVGQIWQSLRSAIEDAVRSTKHRHRNILSPTRAPARASEVEGPAFLAVISKPTFNGGGQECPPHTGCAIFLDPHPDQLLVGFVAAGELEGIGQHGFAFFHAGDDVGTAKPVGFGEVGLRPLRRMIWVRVIEADDVLAALAAFAPSMRISSLGSML